MKFTLDTQVTMSYIKDITKRQNGTRQMKDTVDLVNKIYEREENTNRAVDVAVRDADLSTRRKGLLSFILSLFGG